MSTSPQNPSPATSPSADAASPPGEITAASIPSKSAAMSMLKDVEVEITLEIGRRKMRIADVLKLAGGQTLELGKAAGEPLDIFVNGRLLGRGEAIVLGDRYGVRITEIASDPEGGIS
jgi:flagellar motor switch protein FliN/FliY